MTRYVGNAKPKPSYFRFRCEQSLRDEVQKVAERHNVPASELIRAAIWDLSGSDAEVVQHVIEEYQANGKVNR